MSQSTATYDTIGIGYDTTRRADPFLTERILHLLDAQAEDSILDVACGSGNYTAALSSAGLSMTGVDRSRRMIAAARSKSTGVGWQIGDATALPFRDRTFDGAICTLAIHHIADLERSFREIHRVLNGGRFVIFTASREQMRGYWLNEYFPVAMERSIEQMPDIKRVRQYLDKAGFGDVELEPYTIRPNVQDFFLYSGKHRPEMYLDAGVRSGISTFSLLADPAEVRMGCERLQGDIQSARIEGLIESYANSLGDYMFVACCRP